MNVRCKFLATFCPLRLTAALVVPFALTLKDITMPEALHNMLLLLTASFAVGTIAHWGGLSDGHSMHQAHQLVGRCIRRSPLFCNALFVLMTCSNGHARLFLDVAGVEGDSTFVDHLGWSDVDDFAISVKHGVPSPLHITAPTSSISPHMFFFALGEQTIEKVTLDIVGFVSSPISIARWTLKDATVTEFSTAGDTDGNSTDAYTIDYRSIQYRYTPVNPDGSTSGDIIVQWDKTTGVPTITDNSNGGSFVFLTGNSSLLPPEIIPTDYNGDGTVDAADYVVWRAGFGTTYTESDYLEWRASFGQTAGSSAVLSVNSNPVVAEPTAVMLAGLTVISLLNRDTRRIRARKL